MSSIDQVREHMQVIDAEGTPLGKVDRIEGDTVRLSARIDAVESIFQSEEGEQS